MSSSFGTLLRISTFGESHCAGVGVVIDGVPPRMQLQASDIQIQLDRRRPGQSKLSTERDEADQVEILSGIENGLTLGSPIGLLVRNKDQRPQDYGSMSQIPRPSHADLTYRQKYGIHASSGGGRSSARETIGRVAAGAIADKFLREQHSIEIIAWVSSVGAVDTDKVDLSSVTREQVDANEVRCPDQEAAAKMSEQILMARADKDSIGGILTCVCRNLPPGLGEPAFDRLEAQLAHAMLSIPATKGFEIGSGFAGAAMRGSTHNDPYCVKNGRLGTLSNRS
ncbi:MAG: chorismate synthase, partial [Geopsychrobacter sp.]|nr:chorismate synthase [Geopsychrobacter sp.]